MIQIKRLSGIDEIRTANGTTVGKEYVNTPKDKIYITEHSTLMFGTWFVTTDELCRSACLQLKCHNKRDGFYSVMQSSRPDWTGKSNIMDRKELMFFTMIFSDMALIKISWERLCGRASLETSSFWSKICELAIQHEPSLSGRLVPSCIARGCCKEDRCCGFIHTQEASDARLKYVANMPVFA